MVSSFHPHSMCNKVERVTAKTGCTSCTKRTISFEVSGFHHETRLLFFMHLLIILSYKTMKLKSIWNEVWKCSKLAWYHHFTHIACARKYKGLRQKLDALHVQNSQSPSKYEGFIRKLVCYKGISFLLNLFDPPCFLRWKCTIQSHIINLQPFLTSFVIFHAFTDYFEL